MHLERYSRHLLLPEIGLTGQQSIQESKVLIIGLGGLGCPAAQYLTAAGVGLVGLLDGDIVSESNLQRQILYRTDQINQLKTESAKAQLSALNPNVKFKLHSEFLTRKNARQIVKDYDLVLDCTDTFACRYLICDACYFEQKPHVFASIQQFDIQVAVFNQKLESEVSVNYRDLFPIPPNPDHVLACGEAGVLGITPGIAGMMQATECLKVICKMGTTLQNKLFTYNLLNHQNYILSIELDSENVLRNNKQVDLLDDYQSFCQPNPVNQMPLSEFLELEPEGLLLDVREKWEFEQENTGGRNISLQILEQHIEEFRNEKALFIRCKSGVRARKAVRMIISAGLTTSVIALTPD